MARPTLSRAKFVWAARSPPQSLQPPSGAFAPATSVRPVLTTTPISTIRSYANSASNRTWSVFAARKADSRIILVEQHSGSRAVLCHRDARVKLEKRHLKKDWFRRTRLLTRRRRESRSITLGGDLGPRGRRASHVRPGRLSRRVAFRNAAGGLSRCSRWESSRHSAAPTIHSSRFRRFERSTAQSWSAPRWANKAH